MDSESSLTIVRLVRRRPRNANASLQQRRHELRSVDPQQRAAARLLGCHLPGLVQCDRQQRGDFGNRHAFHARGFDLGDAAPWLRRLPEGAGRTIGGYDILIAGHARSRALVVVTGNRGEFDRGPGLQCEDSGIEAPSASSKLEKSSPAFPPSKTGDGPSASGGRECIQAAPVGAPLWTTGGRRETAPPRSPIRMTRCAYRDQSL